MNVALPEIRRKKGYVPSLSTLQENDHTD